MQPPAFDFLPIKLGSNILDSEFNNNILNTLIPNLVPDLNKLKFLSCKI